MAAPPKRVLIVRLPTLGKPEPLPEPEAEHVTRVLRLKDGDILEALDGEGRSARTTLRIRHGVRVLEFLAANDTPSPNAGVAPLTLEIAILKGEAMEWVVEKAVELGVKKIVPLQTAHTVVQVKNKGPDAFRDRWQKIADQALKQCGRLQRLEIERPMDLWEGLSRDPVSPESPRLWCDEASRDSMDLSLWLAESEKNAKINGNPLQSLRVLIGPEGGWSEIERQNLDQENRIGLQKVSLGPWILRAETAALYAASLSVAALRRKH